MTVVFLSFLSVRERAFDGREDLKLSCPGVFVGVVPVGMIQERKLLVCSLINLGKCVFITAVPIIKLFARGEGDSGGHVLRDGTREEPGTLTQGGALFSLVPLVWESNPKLQGGWCKPVTQPAAHRGI